MNKKIGFIVFLFLVFGCQNQEIKDNQKVNTTNVTKENSSQIDQQPNQQVKVTNEEEGKCSASNPPRVESGKFGETLNKCGQKTEFSAKEFKEEKLILFIEDFWDQEKEKHFYTLKTISTTAPFKETVLIDKNSPISDFNNGKQKADFYVWSSYADGPGMSGYIFIYNPKKLDYLYHKKTVTGNFDADVIFDIGSSVSSGEINEKMKMEFLNCRLDQLSGLDLQENNENIIDKYIETFPSKLPCFNDNNEIIAYFDFTKNEFIKE
jgi:hypothetical protein